MANRRISSEQLLEKLNDDGVINTLLMIDFHLPVYVNKQNYRYWAPENPQEVHQRPLHNERLAVRCGIASFGVLGPYFFEDNEGAAVTVTSKRYVAMLRNFCEPEFRRRGIDLSSVWFQQRWSNSKGINECSAGNISTTRHFLWRPCSMTGTFAWSLRLWLLFMEISHKQSFHP